MRPARGNILKGSRTAESDAGCSVQSKGAARMPGGGWGVTSSKGHQAAEEQAEDPGQFKARACFTSGTFYLGVTYRT